MKARNRITLHSERKLKLFQIVWLFIMLILTILQCIQHFFYYLNYQNDAYFILAIYEIFLAIFLLGMIIFLFLKKKVQSPKERSGVFLSTLLLVLINAENGFRFLAAILAVVIISIFHFSYRKKQYDQ